VFRTIHQLGAGWLRAVGPALAYYWAAAPPPGPAALGWAVGQFLWVPRAAGGDDLGRVTGVEAGDRPGELTLRLATRDGEGAELRLRVVWQADPAASDAPALG
jgi:hypothetical protein